MRRSRARLRLVGIAAFAAACGAPPALPSRSPADHLVPVAVSTRTPADITSLAHVNGADAVVVGLDEGQVGLWDGRANSLTLWLKPHSARVLAVASSADGGELWSLAADGTLARTPAATGAASTTATVDLGSAPTRAAAFSPDGALLATGGEFGDIRVFDTSSGALRHVLRGHRTEIQAIAIRPGAQTIASASAESDLRLWDANSGQEIKTIESELSLFAVTFGPRGDVVAAGGVDRRLTLRDATSWATIGDLSLKAPRLVAALAWSLDGRFLALGDIDDETLAKGTVDIVDATSRQVVATLETAGLPAASLAVLPGGIVIAADGPTLRSWSVPMLAPSRE